MVQSNEGKLQQVQAGKVNMASCLSGWVSSALASATYTFCLWVILIFRRFYSTLPARFGSVTHPARSNATIIAATAMPRNTLNPVVSMRLCEGPCGEYRMNNSSKYICMNNYMYIGIYSQKGRDLVLLIKKKCKL